MRPVARLAVASAMALAVTAPLTGTATAQPARPDRPTKADPTLPSEEKVEAAKDDVAAKRASVTQIENELAAAASRFQAAIDAAQVAAEEYNGARWRLSEARRESREAKAAAAEAKADVEAQKSGIISLVTESYQNGTQLGTAHALLSDEGPEGLMNRYSVVQSAGDSMEAAYDRFRGTLATARKTEAAAGEAQAEQTQLAKEARGLAADAAQAAADAGGAAKAIADKKQELVRALVESEQISVELAEKRQEGLQRIAEQKAAALAEARKEAAEAAERERLRKEAEEARRKARDAGKDVPGRTSGLDPRDTRGPGLPLPVPAPPPVVDPAPNNKIAVDRTIAYAKQQVGKPYQWAAAGPASFDCSGLTMQAWARGGKLLPHYSVAQFQQSTPVAFGDMRAGDLLFWTSNGGVSGIHHVALYIGQRNGVPTMIEAPYTGALVRYMPLAQKMPDLIARP